MPPSAGAGVSRAKGNLFERVIAKRFVEADGLDAHIAAIASSSGRVGHLDIGADIVTRSYAIECKHRESLSMLLWGWLANISYPGKTRLLVIKRNRRPPLVVLQLDDFLTLTRQETPDGL